MTLDEVSELRRRLAEAEDTLRAIQQGDVDALVVGRADNASIFTIEGDAESYRAFMEAMAVGAAAVDEAGHILYLNGNLRRAFQQDRYQGRRFTELLTPGAGAQVEALLRFPPGTDHPVDVRLPGHDDTSHFVVSAQPLQLGTVRGFALTFTDVTERMKAELAAQSERAARAVIASANEAVLVCDRNGVITHVNAAAAIVFDGDPVGMPFAEAIPLVFPDGTGIIEAADIVEMAVQGTSVQGLEVTAPRAPKVKDYLISAAPLHLGDEEVGGCVITMVDLTQRKAAEKQQLLLMRELDHRVKNTLALVLSISSRTLHHEDTLEGFQRAFTGRIQALAATHTLLAENSWTDLTVDGILRAELEPYGGTERLRTTGLDIPIAPRAAIALGLVVHELATNAVKYGALSAPGGRVDVGFVEQTSGDEGALVIEWRESGGPTVAQPTRKGFGQTVIARSLQYSPRGGATLDYAPPGVICRMSIPAEDLR